MRGYRGGNNRMGGERLKTSKYNNNFLIFVATMPPLA
jgi:hypothetical protein